MLPFLLIPASLPAISIASQPVPANNPAVAELLSGGYSQLNEQNYAAAIESFRPALALMLALTNDSDKNDSDNALIGEIQAALGYAHLYLGEYAAAVDHFQGALEAFETLETPEGETLAIEAQALAGLGYAYLDVAEYEAALPLLESAIAQFTTLSTGPNASPHTADLIDLAGALGLAHQELSHFGSALTYYRQALSEDFRAQLQPETQADLLTNVGILETETGQYTQAETTLQQAVALNRELDSMVDEATAIAALGWTYERQEKFAEAIASYQSASTLFQQLGETARATRTLNNLGMVQLKQADTMSAAATLASAQNLLATLENPAEATRENAILLDSFGALYQAQR